MGSGSDTVPTEFLDNWSRKLKCDLLFDKLEGVHTSWMAMKCGKTN